MEVLYIDHYDSFSFNLIDWISRGPVNIDLRRISFDDPALQTTLLDCPRSLLISPGPKAPRDAPQTMELVRNLIGKVPILGVCLGHQILGEVLGFEAKRSLYPEHGACKQLVLGCDQGIFTGYEKQSLSVAAYHSLVVGEGKRPLKEGSKCVARCLKGEVMAIEWQLSGKAPAAGLQFHPESFMTVNSARIRQNWLQWVEDWYHLVSGVQDPLPASRRELIGVETKKIPFTEH